MALYAISLILLALAFAGGAWLMFSSLRAQPELETYCVKCGQNLADPHVEFCPKCRRLLGPAMIVTCTRSAIAPGRFAVGLLVVIAAAALAVRVARTGRAAVGSDAHEPARVAEGDYLLVAACRTTNAS